MKVQTSRVRQTCQWERQHHPPCVLGTTEYSSRGGRKGHVDDVE